MRNGTYQENYFCTRYDDDADIGYELDYNCGKPSNLEALRAQSLKLEKHDPNWSMYQINGEFQRHQLDNKLLPGTIIPEWL